MNRHGSVEILWAGGEHVFRLGLAELDELESATDMSVFVLHASMAAEIPFARHKHYSETIRLGLIGGGLPPLDARALARKYVDERPLIESVVLAKAILDAAMARVHTNKAEEDQSPGEPMAAEPSGSTSLPSSVQPS